MNGSIDNRNNVFTTNKRSAQPFPFDFNRIKNLKRIKTKNGGSHIITGKHIAVEIPDIVIRQPRHLGNNISIRLLFTGKNAGSREPIGNTLFEKFRQFFFSRNPFGNVGINARITGIQKDVVILLELSIGE